MTAEEPGLARGLPEDPDSETLVRAYYDSLDTHDYDRLESLLAPEFRHDRPDMSLEGRTEFVTFMREKRPATRTSHPIETIYHAGENTVAVAGQLVNHDGESITGFVDRFTITSGAISEIKTYTD